MVLTRSTPLVQPATDLIIDRSHPLSRGLVAAIYPSSRGMLEYVNGRVPVFAAGAHYRATQHGRGIFKDAAATENPVLYFNSGVVTNYPVTLFSLYWSTASSSYSASLGVKSVFGDGGCALWHLTGGSANLGFALYNVGTSSSGLAPYTDGRLNYAAAAADGTNVRFMLNGSLAQTAWSSAWGAATPDRIVLLAISAAEGITTGGIHAAYVWNRALSNAELMWLYRNPYAMLRSVSPSYIMQGQQAAPGGGAWITRPLVSPFRF